MSYRCQVRFAHGARPAGPRWLVPIVEDWSHRPSIGDAVQCEAKQLVFVLRVEDVGPSALRITFGTQCHLDTGTWTAPRWPPRLDITRPDPPTRGPDPPPMAPLPPPQPPRRPVGPLPDPRVRSYPPAATPDP